MALPHEGASKTRPSLHPPFRTESPSHPGRFSRTPGGDLFRATRVLIAVVVAEILGLQYVKASRSKDDALKAAEAAPSFEHIDGMRSSLARCGKCWMVDSAFDGGDEAEERQAVQHRRRRAATTAHLCVQAVVY